MLYLPPFQGFRSHSCATSNEGCRIATCFLAIFRGRLFGSSGHRIMKSFLSMAVMTPTHQPMGSPSSPQYFPRTWEPTRNPSQGSRAGAGSGLPLLDEADVIATTFPSGGVGAASAIDGIVGSLSLMFA